MKKGSRWVNVCKYFTDENIWPRGLPLDEISTKPAEVSSFEFQGSSINPTSNKARSAADAAALRAPIQQGLVNNSPDVDAIWRLVLDRPFKFDNNDSVYLTPGNWCPFNTQSTWWWPVAYPLLYIPSNCSFRMCDIWKSFVAQRCLWELDAVVAFHAPEVSQNRNAHNLAKDFRDEIPGYERNRELVEVLEVISLEKGEDRVADNLRSCYEALIKFDFFPEKELYLVDAWLSDLALVPITESLKENL